MGKIDFAARTTDLEVETGEGTLGGFSVAETTGAAPAKVYFRDGAAGTIIAVITLVANESIRGNLGEGIEYYNGLHLDVVSGSVEGSVWVK